MLVRPDAVDMVEAGDWVDQNKAIQSGCVCAVLSSNRGDVGARSTAQRRVHACKCAGGVVAISPSYLRPIGSGAAHMRRTLASGYIIFTSCAPESLSVSPETLPEEELQDGEALSSDQKKAVPTLFASLNRSFSS